MCRPLVYFITYLFGMLLTFKVLALNILNSQFKMKVTEKEHYSVSLTQEAEGFMVAIVPESGNEGFQAPFSGHLNFLSSHGLSLSYGVSGRKLIYIYRVIGGGVVARISYNLPEQVLAGGFHLLVQTEMIAGQQILDPLQPDILVANAGMITGTLPAPYIVTAMIDVSGDFQLNFPEQPLESEELDEGGLIVQQIHHVEHIHLTQGPGGGSAITGVTMNHGQPGQAVSTDLTLGDFANESLQHHFQTIVPGFVAIPAQRNHWQDAPMISRHLLDALRAAEVQLSFSIVVTVYMLWLLSVAGLK
ncbi:hypothetical protein [Endozoicomonas numazuensis]|uniref:Uncharacterized protein n=1 Tax=Endozoicomonas numazuensis TaxID=1137799 RepID=A0A081NEI6_9GAMM|nr:hypothetical protein [Endozoicomonas numazuensis]KEQ16859.1 hypothetical protein GZ78_19550 [Endozoicomonas numazuensis]